MKYVGSPVKRLDVEKYITGRSQYLDDIKIDALYAGFVRSPYAHARIKSIEVSDAMRVQGAFKILTGRELNTIIKDGLKPWPTYFGPPWKYPNWKIAEKEVKYVGEPIAIVIGKDKYAVRDAIDKVVVDYEPLPYAISLEEAEQNKVIVHEELGTNIGFEAPFKTGNPDEALKKANRNAEVEIIQDRLIPSPMEPRGTLSIYNAGYLTVYMSTQAPHIMRTEISRIFGIPASNIRVIAPDVGGGFGSKIQINPEDLAVIASSIILGKPVKWIATRSEEMLNTARRFNFKATIGFNNDGTLVAIKGSYKIDIGTYLVMAEALIPILTILMLPGPYKVRDIEVLGRGIYTNTPPVTIYRGAGRPEATFIIEKIMNTIADELKMDEVEVREKNLIKPNEMPYTNPFGFVYDSGDYPEMLRQAVKKSEYYIIKRWAEEERKKGRRIGVGLAFYLEITSLERWEYCEIRVTESGDVQVLIGSSPHGQGSETAIVQIVADELQIDINRVKIFWGDTGIVKTGVGTFASRTATVTGSAAVKASKTVLEKMKKVASRILKADVQEIEYSNGEFKVKKDPSKKIDWDNVAKAAYFGEEAEVSASATEQAIPTFPYGVHFAVVEVDDLGLVKILEYKAYDDIGKVINPALAEGQIHGGAVQALGQALYERAPINENGQLAATYADYYIPTTVEAPKKFESYFAERPHLSNYAIGSKGVGEAAMIVGVAAIVRAIENAVGKRFNRIPITPEDVIK